jgi:hypothetical protein
LNELHEELKGLDPRRTPVAGLYRILGRLVEHNINTQVAKIESCFHHNYIHSPATVQNTHEMERQLIRAESDHHTVIDMTQASIGELIIITPTTSSEAATEGPCPSYRRA